jgi:DNA polymerase III sliding clamp (beta) subunit (PCNA family)
MATKRFISENYSHRLVLPANEVSSAIARLMKFTKNNKAATEKVTTTNLPVSIKITADEFIIKDKFENVESIDIENGSYTDGDYEMSVNLYDIKLVVDSCKNEHITFNCGNGRSIVITRGAISNLIPELRRV